MDPRDLKQAAKLINNQLASRGLLRGGKSIPFHKPSEDDTTPAKIINIIHELIARRDVEEEERESLAMTLRSLRAQETKQADIIESLKAKNADLARRNGLLESASRSFDHTLRTSEAAQRTLRDEATRIKTVLGQVRTQCANDIRKRDIQITKLKERLTDTRPRGQRAQLASCTIINPANLDASSRAEEETSNIAQETADFLTTLSQNLADENDNLIALVRTTLSTLKAIQGLPDDDHFAQEDQDEERPVVALPADFDKFTTELDQVLFSLKEMLNQPNYVPLEDLAEKEAEITRLVAKNEMLETEWKKAIALVDEWNRTLSRGFTQGVGGEQREKALAQSEDILKNSPKKVGSPRRSVMEVFKERGMEEEEYEEEEDMNEGMRAVLSMVQEEDEEDEEEEEQHMELVAEKVEEEAQAEEEEAEVEAEKEMDEEVDEEAELEPEPAVEEIEQEEQEEKEEHEEHGEQEEPEVEQAEDQEETMIEQQTPQTEELIDEEATQEVVVVQSPIKSSRNQSKRKSRSTPTPTLTPEPQPTSASKRKSSNAKDIPFRQLFEDREIATKSPSMVPKPTTRRRGSTLTALDEPEEIAEVPAKKGRRRSRKEEATLPEEEVPPLPVVFKSTAKSKTPALSKAPVLSKTPVRSKTPVLPKTPAASKTPSRKSPRKKATRVTPELDASARQLVQEELQATPARVLEIKNTTSRRTRSTSLAAEAEKAQTDAEDSTSGQDAPKSRSRRQTRRTVAEEDTMVGETTEISALESIMIEDSAPKLKLRSRASRNKKEPEPEPEVEDLDMLLSKAIRDPSEAPEPAPEPAPVPKRSVRGRKKAAEADTTVETTMLEDTFEEVSKKSNLRRRSSRHKKPAESENMLAEPSAPEPVHYQEIPNAVQVVAMRDGSAEEGVEEEKEGAGGAKLSRARRKSLRNRDKYPRDGQGIVAEPVPVPVEASPSVPKRKRKSTADREGQQGLRTSPRKRVARSMDV